MPKPIGTIGNVDLISGATRQLTDPDNNSKYKILVAYADAGNHTTFRALGSSSGYVAPAAGFKIKQIVAFANAAGSFDIGYGDTSVTNTVAPTTPIFLTSGTATSNSAAYIGASAAHVVPLDFSIGSGKYPFVKAGSAQVLYVHGYEG